MSAALSPSAASALFSESSCVCCATLPEADEVADEDEDEAESVAADAEVDVVVASCAVEAVFALASDPPEAELLLPPA
jgi:hypothetical protein